MVWCDAGLSCCSYATVGDFRLLSMVAVRPCLIGYFVWRCFVYRSFENSYEDVALNFCTKTLCEACAMRLHLYGNQNKSFKIIHNTGERVSVSSWVARTNFLWKKRRRISVRVYMVDALLRSSLSIYDRSPIHVIGSRFW